MRQWLTPGNEAEWLEYRKPDITSTDAAALFGLSPYKTKFEIYHKHASGVEVPFSDTDRTRKGRALELAVAQLAAEQEGWTDLAPFKDYCRIPDERIGSSFDCMATHEGKRILVEIKLVDTFRFLDGWRVEDGTIEAPPHIEIQVQHQMELAEVDMCAIVAYVGAYDCRVIYRERDPAIGKAIRAAVRKFWQDVANKNEPTPDFGKDGEVIGMLFNPMKDFEDRTADDDFERLLSAYDLAKAQAREFDKRADEIKAEIHYLLKDASGAFTQRFKVTTGRTKDTPDREAVAGEIIKGRKGYRQCLVKAVSGKGK